MGAEQTPGLDRRSLIAHFVRISAGIAVTAHLPRAEALTLLVSPSAGSYGRSRRKAEILPLDAVQLDPGPFQEAMERNRVYLLSLDPDRFLHYYRTTAGLPPRADVYPGSWETGAGRMLGHYLSACSMYTATGAQDFRKRQDYIVDELASCQKANGDGYVGGIPDSRRIFREIAAGNIYIDRVGLNGVHAPWYMLHKMCAGLRDAYVYGKNQQALSILTRFSEWCVALTDPLSDTPMQRMLEDEVGGMNEILADMAALTGKTKYMTASRRFHPSYGDGTADQRS